MINENSLKELRKHLPLKVDDLPGMKFILNKDNERMFEEYGPVVIDILIESMIEIINIYAIEPRLDKDWATIKKVKTSYPSSREIELIDIAERAINRNVHLQEQLKKLNTQQEEIIEVKLDDLPLPLKL